VKKKDKIVRDRLLVENFIEQKRLGHSGVVEGLAQSFSLSKSYVYKLISDHEKSNPDMWDPIVDNMVDHVESKGAMDAIVESKLKNPERLTVSNAITEESSTTSWWKRFKSFWSKN
jgi:AraC-like DNA-binding protein